MRFVRLIVDGFQAIEHAEIELAPGLNILYGPNDLGKSTLASAIRAALLLPHGSTESAKFEPWVGNRSPRVQLELVDAQGRFWRVTKQFCSQQGSILEFSKDGVTYLGDAKAREVDDKLRAMLAWGAQELGGKSGSRGLPETFLAHTLLGVQTDVDAILRESLEQDQHESGKLSLTKALQAFAQDPKFKQVLAEAQREVDKLFTETGRFKSGKASPFTKAQERARQFKRVRLLHNDTSVRPALRSDDFENASGMTIVGNLPCG